ncbi:hypothetical protein MRX96_047297 [Rhipicephalus microplus]
MVDVLGRSTKMGPFPDPTLCEEVVDAWMGGVGKKGASSRRQRDAYEALTMLNTMVGTQGVFDVALNLATELSRVFFLGGGVADGGQDSYGLSCLGDSMATGKHFGKGGPMVKKYAFDDEGTVGNQLEWIRFYFLSPAGMLSEGTASTSGYVEGK